MTNSESGRPNETADRATDDDGSRHDGGTILDDGGIDTDARAGRSLGIDPDKEPDDQTKREIEEERERRLDPDNRPDAAEGDNTDRTFDTARGKFTDAEDYDESEPPRFVDPENPNNPERSDQE